MLEEKNIQFLKSPATKNDILVFLKRFYPNITKDLQFNSVKSDLDALNLLRRIVKPLRDKQFIKIPLTKQDLYILGAGCIPYVNEATWLSNYSADQQVIINALELNSCEAFQNVAGNKLEWWAKAEPQYLLDGNDNPVSSNLEPIATLLDQSGHNRHSSKQNVSTARPKFLVNGINNLNSIEFDGDDYLTVETALNHIPQGDSTIFVVSYRYSVSGFIEAILSFNSVSTYNLIAHNPDIDATNYRNNTTFTNVSILNQGLKPTLFVGRREGPKQAISYNGNPEISSNDAENSTVSNFQLGRSGAGLIGQTSEVIIIGKSLAPDKKSLIENYLINKYNIV